LATEDVSDHELLRRFVGGDERAFEALVRRQEDRIFALTYRITGNRADALEATQETFLSVFRAAASFRGGSEVSTWIHRIGINAARDALRRRRRAPIADDRVEVLAAEPAEGHGARATAPGVEEVVVTRVDLARALASLPDDYREAVVMHDVGGVPYEEIARVTGVALGTVKSRISRGRRLLAQRLEHRAVAPASKEPR
jgi:RNA polymerase sigma-70 factor (ECF subfamily)